MTLQSVRGVSTTYILLWKEDGFFEKSVGAKFGGEELVGGAEFGGGGDWVGHFLWW